MMTFVAPLWTCSNISLVLLVLGFPGLAAVLQMGSHRGRAEDNSLPLSAGHSFSDAAQDIVGLLDCTSTLLAHVQQQSTRTPPPQYFSEGLLSLSFFSQSVHISVTASTQVQQNQSNEFHYSEENSGGTQQRLASQEVAVPQEGEAMPRGTHHSHSAPTCITWWK